MNFLIDAHLPHRLIYLIQEAGYDAIHTLDLAQKNRTTDREINTLFFQGSRVVVTKDDDFVNSFITQGHPYKLLLVSTGNISNLELEQLF